jgi:hypothetical protein
VELAVHAGSGGRVDSQAPLIHAADEAAPPVAGVSYSTFA